MNDFTKGEWVTDNKCGWVDVECNGSSICTAYGLCYTKGGEEVTCEDTKHNAHLIATAGTTATKLAEAGYDAVKVLEVLPEIMQAMIYIDEANVCETTSALLKQCRGE